MDFTRGPLLHAMIGATWPQALSIGVQIACELATVILVARASVDLLAVLGYLAGVSTASYALALALGDGVALALSPLFGRGDSHGASWLLLRAGAACAGAALALAVTCLASGPALAWLLSVPEALREAFLLSLTYVAVGFVAKVLLYCGFGALRASGRIAPYSVLNTVIAALQPAAVLAVLALMDARDVATLAHVVGLSYVVPFLLGILALAPLVSGRGSGKPRRSERPAELEEDLRRFVPLAGSVVAIALFSPAVVALTAYLVSLTTPEVVAAYAVANKLQPFLFVGVLAWLATLSVALGQNLGAREAGRALRTYDLACACSLGWQLAVAVLAAVVAGPLATLLLPPGAGEGQAFFVAFCSVVPFGYGFWAVTSMATKALTLIGNPARGVAASALRNFGLVVPCMVAGSALSGAHGLLWGLTVGNVAAGLVLYPLARAKLARDPSRSGSS